MGFAKADVTDQDNVGLRCYKIQTEKILNLWSVDLFGPTPLEIFEGLDEKPTGKKCAGMAGLVKEGEEIMDEDFSAEVMDAALISAAQRVEHYEIAAYGCVSAWAHLLGESEANALLEKTLEEEKETDQKLTQLAEEINIEAKGSVEEEEEESDETIPGRKAKSARA